jgi:membrane-associated phospholipid phosphatase
VTLIFGPSVFVHGTGVPAGNPEHDPMDVIIRSNVSPSRVATRGFAARSMVVAGAWILILAATCVVGYFVVGPSGLGWSAHLDLSIARFISHHRPSAVAGAAEVLPTLGLGILAAVVLGTFVWSRRNRLLEAVPAVIAVALSGVGAFGLSTAVKEIFTRPRPPRSLAVFADNGFSFPSSHSTVGVAMLVTLVLVASRTFEGRSLRIAQSVAVAVAIAMPVSRVFLGVHWASDVVIGMAAGASWGLLSYRLCRRPLPAERPQRSRRVQFAVLGSSLAALLLVAPVFWSFENAMSFPGNADVGTRTTDWLRREGAGGIVNWFENARFARRPSGSVDLAESNHPFAGRTSGSAWPGGPAPVAVPGSSASGSSHVARLFDGRWVAVRDPRSPRPLLYTADWRPDPAMPGVSVAGVWMDAAKVRPRLVAGTREPGGTGWPWKSQVPAAQHARVVAALNGGFRLREANGGFMTDGKVAVPLRVGAASFVIHRDGSADIERWTRAAGRDGSVVAVRQNLNLIVDHGVPVGGLQVNAHGEWGSTRNQLQYTWRSALGVDARGNLVYVAGGGLNLQTLATALSQAGAVRGMQLDIHHSVVTFNLFEPAPGHSGKLIARKLLPEMSKPATRYLEPDQRDFIAILTRAS